MTQRTLLLAATATAVLALAACNQAAQQPATGAPIASLPLAEAAPPPETVAPQANQLPPAPPIRRISAPRRPVYSYVDDAYQLGDAFADSPPDYMVDYDGETPWIWRSRGGEYRVVEQTPDGWREYYYRGDGDYPFLVRDAGYAYAYDGPLLVEVYDSYGRPYPNYGARQIDYASRYLIRARAIYGAAIHQQRRAAYAADWREHRAALLAPQQQWAAEQQRNADWRRVHDERIAQDRQREAAWTQERTQRQAYAARAAAIVAAGASTPRTEPRRDLIDERLRADAQRDRQADLAAQAARQQQVQADAQRRQADLTARDQVQARAEAQRRQAEQAQLAAKAQHEQQQQAERAARDNRAQALQLAKTQHAQQMQASRAVHDRQAQADQLAKAEHQRQMQADRAGRDQQAQAAQVAKAQREQQAQASQIAKAQHEQQAQAQQAAKAQHEQQAQAQQAAKAQHEQQAQAQQAAKAQHEQQAKAAQQAKAEMAQQRQAEAAQQHGKAAAAQAAAQPHPAQPHPDKGKPEKKHDQGQQP